MTKNEVVLFVVISIQFLFTSHFQISLDNRTVLRRARVVSDIFSTIRDIFVQLKNGNNFTASKHAADNFLIHKFIQNVKNIYADKYEEINNISRAPNYDEKTKYIISVISKTVHRIIKKEWKNYNKSKVIMRSAFHGVVGDGEAQGRERGGGALLDFVRFERNFRRGAELTSAMVVSNLLFENSTKLFARAPSRPQVDRDVEAWEPAATRRLFGGRAASVAEFPFVCSVHVDGDFACAGAILSKRAVITAASCLWRSREAPRRVRVRVGSDLSGAAGALVRVRRMVFHARFDINSLSNNLVLLELQDRLKFGDGIRKIKFDTEAAALPESVRDICVLGWEASGVSNVEDVGFWDSALLAATEPVYDADSCRAAYTSYYVRDTHFCTGLVDGGSGACISDIGGPAVAGRELVGLVSFGPARCGARDQPTVYTKLGFYAAWIANVTDQIAAKSPTRRQKKQKSKEIDLDSVKLFAGELQEVLRTKFNDTVGQAEVNPRCDDSGEEKDIIKSDARKKISKIGPEEEKDPEPTESNIITPTHQLLKSKFKKYNISTIVTKNNKVTIPRLYSPPTKNIELQMAYDSSDTNISNAKTYSSASEDDDSSENEEITLPFYNNKLSKEADND